MSLNEIEEKTNIRELDLRGKVCPMTFVHTKLKLEELKKGEILKVILDYPPAIENVPESCKRQSLADVLDIENYDLKDNEWELTLKKK